MITEKQTARDWQLYGENILTDDNTLQTVYVAPNIDKAVWGVCKHGEFLWLALKEHQEHTIATLYRLLKTHNVMLTPDIYTFHEWIWLVNTMNHTRPRPDNMLGIITDTQPDW